MRVIIKLLAEVRSTKMLTFSAAERLVSGRLPDWLTCVVHDAVRTFYTFYSNIYLFLTIIVTFTCVLIWIHVVIVV